MHNTYMKNDITQGAESLSALFGYLEDTAEKDMTPERMAILAEAALLAEENLGSYEEMNSEETSGGNVTVVGSNNSTSRE